MNTNVIHTYLYGKTAEMVLQKFASVCLNGFPTYSGILKKAFSVANIIRSADNEIIIKLNDNVFSYRHTKWQQLNNETESKIWIAKALKKFIYDYISMNSKSSTSAIAKNKKFWNRNSDFILNVFSEIEIPITISKIYYIYEILMNRKDFKHKYNNSNIYENEIVGIPRDPATTEMIYAYNEELAKIKLDYNDQKTQLQNNCYSEIKIELEKLEKQIRQKYSDKLTNLKSEYDKKVIEITNIINAFK